MTTQEQLRLLHELEALIEDWRGDPYAHTADRVIVTARTDDGEPVL